MTAVHRRRRLGPLEWIVVAGLVLLVAWTAWLGVRGAGAAERLAALPGRADELQEALVSGDLASAERAADDIRVAAHEASDLTGDPVWRLSEGLPWLGANLAAVRGSAGVATALADDALPPLVASASRIDPSSFGVHDGAVDLEGIVASQQALAQVADALADARDRATGIDVARTVRPLRSALGELLPRLDELTETADALERTSVLLPSLLGGDGARTTLVLVQNNAELRASGGVSGALVLIRADDGRIELADQASGGELARFPHSVLPLDVATRSLYGEVTGRYVHDVNLTPWFDTSAQLAAEMWEQRRGGRVDQVVAVDPVLLAYLLEAIGPVEVRGVELTASNAVEVLLSDSYARFPDPTDQDAFFADVAQAVFGQLLHADASAADGIVRALVRGGDEGRIRIWSSHEADQTLLAQTSLDGIPASDAAGGPTALLVLNDATGAKMDYYLTGEVEASVCRAADGTAVVQIAVEIGNDAPEDAARSLPAYVTGGGAYGVAPGDASTLVAVYGPVGARVLAATLDDVATSGASVVDRDRPVFQVRMTLSPGETQRLVVEFIVDDAPEQVTVNLPPTVRPVTLRQLPGAC
ncbi:DUF4012 domain-containing protein [Homoserinibacter sp. GY 40078]|uniref:DUF4012 domain-containing protein n=1 Tax=Homoserinibacter sp. GY 40078 TaxID=2603275 RepID=UPI0011CC82A5|nr:DUF4012 domain-containing protein [Homoserinibacter sp. GY 40078]TXK19503.1 DUF4012 domain-containing protein [Homoserinibacter sp. GY 40078]